MLEIHKILRTVEKAHRCIWSYSAKDFIPWELPIVRGEEEPKVPEKHRTVNAKAKLENMYSSLLPSSVRRASICGSFKWWRGKIL